MLGTVPEWQPVLLSGLRAGELGPFRCAAEVDAYREDIERRAVLAGIQPLRWPEEFPPDAEWAMLVATFAKQIGRARGVLARRVPPGLRGRAATSATLTP